MIRRLPLLGSILAIAIVAASCSGGDSPPNSPAPGTGSPAATSTTVPPTGETSTPPATEPPEEPTGETPPSGSPSPPATEPPAEPPEEPTGETPPSGDPSPAEQTGVVGLDVIVDAVLAGDGDLLADRLVTRECPTDAECEHIAPEQRGEAFPATSCRTYFSSAEDARDDVRSDWGSGSANHAGIELHAIYVTNHRPYDILTHYALVFRNPISAGTHYRELLTDADGGIILVNYGCSGELPHPDRVVEWIIEPTS